MKYVGETQNGLDAVYKLASKGGIMKVTRIENDGWNEMEGNLYTVTIKATAPKGKVWSSNKRKSMLFQFDTNSTWLEPEDDEDEEATEQELIKEMVYNTCL